MHVARPAIIDKCLVKQSPRAGEIELFESTVPRFLNRNRAADRAAGILVESRAIDKQTLRLGVLAADRGDPAEHEQRERLPPLVAGRFGESLSAKAEWLERVGALPATVERKRKRRFDFAAHIAKLPRQRDCFAEDVIAALRVVEAIGKDSRTNRHVETRVVARLVRHQRALEPRPTLGEMPARVPEF